MSYTQYQVKSITDIINSLVPTQNDIVTYVDGSFYKLRYLIKTFSISLELVIELENNSIIYHTENIVSNNFDELKELIDGLDNRKSEIQSYFSIL